MNANTLLSDPAAIEIEKFVSRDGEIVIVVRTVQSVAACPKCDVPSSSLKSRCTRRLADLPWHNIAIRLELHTRKFRCRNSSCQQKVFCERLPNVVAPGSRRTVRLETALTTLAFALGARATSRLVAPLFGLTLSKDTGLNLMRRHRPNSETAAICVLGVDDFAFRRGCTYGTILVDLERHQPIDLLPDREVKTLSEWLRRHPEIETISRDRSVAYADAINNALPRAEQIADRWHSLKNLSYLFERSLLRQHDALRKAAQETRAEYRTHVTVTKASLPEPPEPPAAEPLPDTEDDNPRRAELSRAIKELRRKGVGLRQIARELKIARNTVRRYIRCETVPRHRTGAGRPSFVLPFAEYLEARWQEGEHNATKLAAEIKAQGFRGGVDAVHRFVKNWRKTTTRAVVFCPISIRGYSPRRTTKLLLNTAAKTEAEKCYVAKLCENSPEINRARRLGIEFQRLISDKRAAGFDEWLKKVAESEVAEFESWAKGLLTDESAVRNALLSRWSQGQVEGQVNRLKTIKRQMYGRAKFDLLRARVLYQG